jgi:hypothetical protein
VQGGVTKTRVRLLDGQQLYPPFVEAALTGEERVTVAAEKGARTGQS